MQDIVILDWTKKRESKFQLVMIWYNQFRFRTYSVFCWAN